MPLPFKYLKLSDFTPGIVSYTGSQTQVIRDALPGVASETNTYRCFGLQGGGLGPLPAISFSYTIPTPAGTPQNNSIVINGLGCIGKVFSSGTTWTAVNGDEIHIGLEWQDGASKNPAFAWYSFQVGTSVATLRASLTTAIASATLQTTPFSVVVTRIQSSSAPINNTVVASWHDPNLGNKRTWFFPNPTSPASNTPLAITTKAGMLFAHQGRVFMFSPKSYSHGASYIILTNESIDFTAPPLSTTFGDQGMLLSPNNAVGYGSWASLGDQGFILVKQFGGAIVVHGDLTDQPIVILQQNVDSTGEMVMPAVVTPLGIMWCDQKSIFLWDGTTTHNISRQLKDEFHVRPDPITNVQFAPRHMDCRVIQAAYWDDYVVFPNNFMYSTISKSWWRLEDVAVFAGQVFVASSQSRKFLYATGGAFAPGAAGQLKQFSTGSQATSYSWESQPMSIATGRRIDIREIEIVAQASTPGSTVIVSTTNQAGVVQNETFTLTNVDQPQRLRVPTYTQGYSVIVRIQANSNSSLPAPIVYSVNLGYHEAQSTASAA